MSLWQKVKQVLSDTPDYDGDEQVQSSDADEVDSDTDDWSVKN